jgi:uncharacterized protein (TIGR03083 family)
MPDLGLAYNMARTSMIDLALQADDAQLKTTVPACPEWTVKDLVGHVTSIAATLVAGEIPEDLKNLVMLWDAQIASTREAFVDEQLELRRERSIEEITEEWSKAGEIVDSMLRGEQPMPPNAPTLAEWVLVTDVGVHHHDLRGALGKPGDRESLTTGLSLRSYVEGMRMAGAVKGLPTLRINAGSRSWVTGDGEPQATLTADPFELARAAAGRRSPDQIRAFSWEGDPEPFLPLFYPYGPRTEPLVE